MQTSDTPATPSGGAGISTDPAETLKRAYLAIKDLRTRLEQSERFRRDPIAVIGMGCRFPGGADTPQAFWELLRNGVDATGDVPGERWDVEAYFDPNPDVPGKTYQRRGAFLGRVDGFDAPFFGIAPREVLSMDPQQRLLLEVAWEALENAGQAPDRLSGSGAGVFVGISSNDYSQLVQRGGAEIIDAYTGTGGAMCVAAGRISYVLSLHGPNVAIDTACSSSLVAVHLACQSLRSGQSRIALAGGVNLILAPDPTVYLSKVRALSASGQCRSFDASADGYVRGEGCGLVVLKRLSDAIADRDTVLAVIRAAVINHDGKSSGLTVPNAAAQQSVIAAALEEADIAPAEVGYLEAHGTGTPLGDPIEARAALAVLGRGRSQASPLLMGSVKTNIGHLEAAAGVSGLIKLVLAVKHGEVPPSLHFDTPSPHIAWDELPVVVPTTTRPWRVEGGKRIGGVNAFGFSGTNAHVIVEEPPPAPIEDGGTDRGSHILVLSARDEVALAALAARHQARLPSVPEAEWADACHTAAVGRAHFAQRLAIVAATRDAACDALSAYGEGRPARALSGRVPDSGRPRLAFLYTGQGSQHAGMGRELYETQPTFRRALERCAEVVRGELERPLLEVMFGGGEDLDETQYTQPALFALEWSLSELWRSFGVRPTWVMGHSVGEYVAACVAGAYTVEEGLHLIAARGRLMGALARDGAMVSVVASEGQVEEVVGRHGGEVSIAAVNGPQSVVISGRREAVERAARELEEGGAKTKELSVSHAFHSALLEPMLGEFERVASQVEYRAAELGVVSNLTGGVLGAGELSGRYWRRHARERVRFKEGMEVLREQGCAVFVEVGPRPVLLGMGRECIGEGAWLPTLRKGRRDWEQLLEAVGELYVRGVDVDWAGFDRDYTRRKVALPTYPFQRQRYWLEAAEKGARAVVSLAKDAAVHPLLGRRVRSASGERLFENEVSSTRPSYLRDHAFFGTPVFPAAGYLEMALASLPAAAAVVVEHLSIEEALLLPAGEQRVVQCVAGEDGSFRICSLEDEGSSRWRRHASGRAAVLEAGEPLSGDLDAARGRCAVELDPSEYYDGFQAAGVEYGPAFRVIRSLWSGEREAVGRLELPEVAGSFEGYRVHPALLDAAFQVLGAAQALRSGDGVVHMPTGVERLVVHGELRGSGWAHACLREVSAKRLLVDVAFYDESGQPRLEVTGLELRPARRETLARSLPKRFLDWLYLLDWVEKPLEALPSGDGRGHWLILADPSGPGGRLARLLESRGESSLVVHAQTGAQLDEAVRSSLSAAHPFRGAVFLDGLEPATDTSSLLAERGALAGALRLVQTLARLDGAGRPGLWIVTSRAVHVGADDELTCPHQAPLWGLARTATLEHPGLRVSCVDVESSSGSEELLLAELLTPGDENQIAYRAGTRRVARLVRMKSQAATVPSARPGENLQLQIQTRGVLDNLRLNALPRTRPGRGQVEIEVQAAGLNFRDVLNALGMYPGDPGPLGGEFAGRVVGVGEGVEGVVEGDELLGLASATFSTHVVTSPELTCRRPRGLTPEEAATIPIVFLTALYALDRLARLKKGERVLVHAGAGGVGMAAIQLARRIGAEVYATAGSDRKRGLLRSMGVDNVSDSRSLGFADEVLRQTGGEGVDVVLNSLADEFIPRSLSLLRKGGRFLEIGKRGIWDPERVREFRPDVDYHVIYLGEIAERDPGFVHEMLSELVREFEAGTLAPLPHTDFPVERAAEAFRYMGQARHVGKVVLRLGPRDIVRREASYLVTGGLGGLGLATARWLVEQGAGSIALMSRRAPTEEARRAIAELERMHARVLVLPGDVSRREDVEAALEQIDALLPPLRGVLHAAGVLDDGVLLQQTPERFAPVMAAKVDGAWHLHELTRARRLDFFVLFSSVASLLGSPGQANYSAANAFLDALAAHRHAAGLPALSINWGPWADVGMAAAGTDTDRRRRDAQGVQLIPLDEGTRALGHLLAGSDAQVAVWPADWPRFLSRHSAGAEPPVLRAIARETSAAPKAPGERAARQAGDLRKQVETAPPTERAALVLGHLREQVARVLGLHSAGALSTGQNLLDLGMDSLMAVELRNRLESSCSVTLAAGLLFEHPTIDALAAHLAGLMEPSVPPSAAAPEHREVDAAGAEDLLARLSELPDSDVDALLRGLSSRPEEGR